MPRGNDSEAAGQEMKAKLGANPNAEDLIGYANRMMTPELRAASNRQVDQKATDELDASEAEGKVDDGQYVLSYAVRSPFLVVVSEDEEGYVTKQAFPLDEDKVRRIMPKSEEPDEDAEDQEGVTAEGESAPETVTAKGDSKTQAQAGARASGRGPQKSSS